jgi:hypothetical protein
MLARRPAPYCSNWGHFEDWSRFDYNRCECEYMSDAGMENVYYDADGYDMYADKLEDYLCGHCLGRRHGQMWGAMNHAIKKRQLFAEKHPAADPTVDFTPFLKTRVGNHESMAAVKARSHGREGHWAAITKYLTEWMPKITAAAGEEREKLLTDLCDYLTSFHIKDYLVVHDEFRASIKTTFAGDPAADPLLDFIANIEANP